MKVQIITRIGFWLSAIALVMAAFGPLAAAADKPEEQTLILGAYTVPKEAYEKEIIPSFQKMWLEKTGKNVKIEQSYVGSGAQARAIIGGFEADVAALSLEGDMQQIVDAKMITHDWKALQWKGFITRSVVVIGYRPGNPKQITDWDSLTRDGIDVLCPNPKTSGGAQWFINAVYGGGMKMAEAKTGKKDEEAGRKLLTGVMKRIKVMDKSGRESVTTFERGIGDALITYENEALLRVKEGKEFPFVIPPATMLIENPAAVVDKYADKHGTRELAEAFVKFLHTDEVQRIFARYGFRPANPEIAKEVAKDYPEPAMLFDADYLGGWTKINQEIYGEDGIYTKISREINLR